MEPIAISLVELLNAPATIGDISESVCRSYKLLQTVKAMLAQGTPGPVVLAFIVAVDGIPAAQNVPYPRGGGWQQDER